MLRKIPQVNDLAAAALADDETTGLPRQVVLDATRRVVERLRETILSGSTGSLSPSEFETESLAGKVREEARRAMKPRMVKVINASGVILHTNLGRSPLSIRALEAVVRTSRGYCNLEYRLDEGTRGSRQDHLESLLCALTGAEAAVVVNNNAAAVLLVVSALAKGREVIVSRGQLVEIGDSFRLPDIMSQGGARLIEVGTTNRTRLEDFSNAIGPETALIMNIHKSNFKMVGYTEDVPLSELVELGRQHFIPVAEDLGSGSLVDLEPFGLEGEHTAGASIAQGADLVTFSGDKLLGGPQAGLIVGTAEYVEEIRRHPLARAVRSDKMAVAALEATLREYLEPDSALESLPALRMLSEPAEKVKRRANKLKRALGGSDSDSLSCEVVPETSRAGGGTLPTAEIPTFCLSVSSKRVSAAELEIALRGREPAVVCRVHEDRLLFDLRTVSDDEINELAAAIAALA